MIWYCFVSFYVCCIIVKVYTALILLQLSTAIKKYNITAENLYNEDKKGFLIGHTSSTQRIMSVEALRSGQIQYASKDASREFISLLAYIPADGITLPPSLIYKGESGDLQDTWLED